MLDDMIRSAYRAARQDIQSARVFFTLAHEKSRPDYLLLAMDRLLFAQWWRQQAREAREMSS